MKFEEKYQVNDKDFEVLPVGSLKELIEVRKFAATLIELNKQGDLAAIRKEIDGIRKFYELNFF